MPKRTDLKKILLIGSGPIQIGQACEFDYSGTQALKALREEGYQVILVNSNPATIMTDPDLSDKVYVEPLTPEYLEEILKIEKPDALLPTMGGQTALNLTMELHARGILAKYDVEILGAKPDVIHRAEDRDAFKETMDSIGILSAKSRVARTREDGAEILKTLGLPCIFRPSFTLGGEGGGSAFTEKEFYEKLDRALFLSPTKSVLIEESLLNWKEFELEVVRDTKDNVIIVCSIENFDPMGVHTGDSITVAPAQTLTDREYQNLRDQAIRIIRAIGVETGGSNIQFAINPRDGRIVVIEMNPRVSRSSALASKATGFPIARVAAKLAVGYTLDELTNDITASTPSSFEPSIDYVVTKIPRFDFEKFQQSEPSLTTQMKSVGEVMAMGRTFQESLGKALSGLETSTPWLSPGASGTSQPNWRWIENNHPKRIWALADAFRASVTIDEIHKRSGIDPWFLRKIKTFIDQEAKLKTLSWPIDAHELRHFKKNGWTDRAIAETKSVTEKQVRELRDTHGIHAVFQSVDTCAAEFEAKTPYLYSSYSGEDESRLSKKEKVMILGGGPNRIGQGIEFDYCCVHASMALRDLGYETIMVNCNPETVSTDFDISDRLYFEPLTVENILNIARIEKPLGVLVQFGGQTPLKLANALEAAGLKILGTSTEAIDLAENRQKCALIVNELEPMGLLQPPNRSAHTEDEALKAAQVLGYPVLVRPSYVLGGRGMKIVHDAEELTEYIEEAILVSDKHPVLIDRFLGNAIEVDVDAICDGTDVIIGGVMEHVQEAGVHSGDSSCSLPTTTLGPDVVSRVRVYTRELAKRFQVKGLLNLQFAIQGKDIYLLEINPRASRTSPFVSKATGYPLIKIAVGAIMGKSLKSQDLRKDLDLNLRVFNVKEVVFPFHKFPNVDPLLGPEMKSTGEVMGRGKTFAAAYAKAQVASGVRLPNEGRAFLSVNDQNKAECLEIARDLDHLGFELVATSGTAQFLNEAGLVVASVNKVKDGSPHCVDELRNGRYALVINTVGNRQSIRDSFSIRRAALEQKVPFATLISSAKAMVRAIQDNRLQKRELFPL